MQVEDKQFSVIRTERANVISLIIVKYYALPLRNSNLDRIACDVASNSLIDIGTDSET